MTRKVYLVIVFFLVTLLSFCQQSFEKGKINFSDGSELECYIKFLYTTENPDQISYKIDLNSEISEDISLNKIISYEIYNKAKYIKASIDFDISSIKEPFSNLRDPEFVKIDALLEVLIDSKADLFKITRNDITRYYYRFDDNDIKPLIYKKYRLQNSNVVKSNINFISDINSDLQCEGIFATSTNLSYTESSLKKYFFKYNDCVGSNINFEVAKKKIFTKLFGKFGYGIANYNVSASSRDLSGRHVDYKHNKTVYYLGAIGEFNLPYSNRKFSLITGLDYIDYTADFSSDPNRGNYYSDFSVNTKALRIPLGLRYNIFLNDSYDTGIIYLEGTINFFIPIGNETVNELSRNTLHNSPIDNTYDVIYNPNLSFSVGFPIYKNLGGALVYDFNRDLLKKENLIALKIQTISFQINYRVL